MNLPASLAACSSPTAAESLRAHLMAAAPCVAPSLRAGAGRLPVGLVDVREAAPGLRVLPAPVWSHPELRFLVRPEVAERLARATAALPENLRLGYWEGLRPISVQRSLWESGMSYLRAAHPQLGPADLETVLEKLVARPGVGVPPHSTGSAVDLAPVDVYGRVLGPTDSWGRMATELTAQALHEAGLANYQPEWWHWSYGDAEWALTYDCAPLPFAAAPALDEARGAGDGI